MKKKLIFIVPCIIVLLISLLLSALAYFKYTTKYIKTYIASHQIMQRNMISEIDLEEVLVPKEYLNDDVYILKEDIIGKYTKLGYSIPKGSLFYKTSLEVDGKDFVNNLLLEDQINYDIYTNDVKINTGSLLTNMYVDLYLSINANDKPISDILLKDCRITALYDQNNKQVKDFDLDSKIYIVSIAIEKQQVSLLNKALMVGNVSIVTSSKPYESNIRSSVVSNSQVLKILQ